MQVDLFSHSLFSKLPNLSIARIVFPRVARRLLVFAEIAILALSGLPVRAAEPPDLTQKSLEDLMNIAVTSVSKKEQKTSQAAAAIFVISRDDIRRSGALNIPDLLRMVPGLDVAQIDSGNWAISARGMNGYVADDLLVPLPQPRQLLLDLGQRHLRRGAGLLGLDPLLLTAANCSLRLLQASLQALGFVFRRFGPGMGRVPGCVEALDLIVEAAQFGAVERDLLVQPGPLLAMPADALAQVGRLLG